MRQESAEIMCMFRHFYQDKWAPENIFKNKSRAWIKAFNDLVKKGFIKKKKEYPGYKYKWVAAWPPNY